MDNSETRARIINLGKALVAELDAEERVDTLSKWIAHYIAGKLVDIEQASGTEKAQLEESCFQSILSLWDHRASLPNGSRPFQNFEPIFRTLERLNPENLKPFYFPDQQNFNKELESEEEIQNLLNVALAIDDAAKVLIDLILKEAIKTAKDEKTISWLENATDATNYNEILIIRYAVSDNSQDDTDVNQGKKNKAAKRIESKIEKLDTFLKMSVIVRNQLEENMKNL